MMANAQASDLQQGNDVLVVLDIGDAHAHNARKCVHDNLIVEGMRLVLQPVRDTVSLLGFKNTVSSCESLRRYATADCSSFG